MRASGILLHISSLPSEYGIGTFGEAAFAFVDFLKKAGQKYWQILPISPTGYGDSPYQSFSTFAGNPYFIDLALLEQEGWLEKKDYVTLLWGEKPDSVDYMEIFTNRFPVLQMAYARFCERIPQKYGQFLEENADWLEDYALFMALKKENGHTSWQDWEPAVRRREPAVLAELTCRLAKEIGFWKFTQYCFYTQLAALKKYANENGVHIIGDLPIYVAMDSVDVWSNPMLFQLDGDLQPTAVAGCPPDYFSKTGQLWGNPLYRWDIMKSQGYDWWVRRMTHALGYHNTIRIDHFRGFESYYAVPANEKTAEKGRWEKGPDTDLFQVLQNHLPNASIIAEDLGLITEPVRNMLKATGYPGMKILQFAFNPDEDNLYLPHNFEKNCVCYTGTHDNSTIHGWLLGISLQEARFVMDYCGVYDMDDCIDGLIRLAMGSPANLAVIPMQDYLKLSDNARMNVPSTGEGNWRWRMLPDALDDRLAERLLRLSRTYKRNH